MPASTDETFMWAALAEARRGMGHVSPNPAVGAVLVQRGRITASGYHRASGLPHAEIECLAAAPGALPSVGHALCHARTVFDHRPHPALHRRDR